MRGSKIALKAAPTVTFLGFFDRIARTSALDPGRHPPPAARPSGAQKRAGRRLARHPARARMLQAGVYRL